MPLRCKIDVVTALKNAGYSTYRIRKEKLMGESALQKLREKEFASFEILELCCRLLDCQPGDIMEYIPNR